MACNLDLDSRFGQSEVQGKTMFEATWRLLDTVNAMKVMRITFSND